MKALNKKNIFRYLSICILTIAMVCQSQIVVHACTGLYVGEKCSKNGSVYFGRSEDIADNYCKIFGVSPPQNLPKGSMYEDVYGFKIPYSGHIYGYTYVKDASVYGETMKKNQTAQIGEPYGSAGVNEKGVCISATVSTECSEISGEIDPLDAERGIREISIASVVLGKASTARKGVEYLAKILDKYGAGECNSLMIGDKREVWYMEILTGHQYVAVRMPTTKISFQPNIMVLGAVDVKDKKNVIASSKLVSLAKSNGFLVTDKKNRIHISKTYAPKNMNEDQTQRYCQGLFYFTSQNFKNITRSQVRTFIKPSKKLTTLDVLKFFSYRGAGSSCDADKGISSSAIGNNNQAECHVFEIRKNMPKSLATLQWQALSDAEFSLYIPYYSTMLNKVNSKYNVDSEAPVDKSLNWVFSEINSICYDYRLERGKNLCGENISKYFQKYQERLIQNQKKIDKYMVDLYKKDPKAAQEKANEIGMIYSEEIYKMVSGVLVELNQYLYSEPHVSAFVPTAMEENIMPPLPIPIGSDTSEPIGMKQDKNLSQNILYAILFISCILFYIVFRKRKNL